MVDGSGGVVKAPGGAPDVGASLERPGMRVQAIFGLCPTPGSLFFLVWEAGGDLGEMTPEKLRIQLRLGGPRGFI